MVYIDPVPFLGSYYKINRAVKPHLCHSGTIPPNKKFAGSLEEF